MGEITTKLDKDGYSYREPVKKLLLNQFGAAIFGFMLYAACRENLILKLLTGIFSAFFFMFLLYTAMWDIGAKDMVRIDGGRAKLDKLRGTKAALYANIPNIALALISVAFFALNKLTMWNWTSLVSVFSGFGSVIWQAMYSGILANIIPQGTDLTIMQSVLSRLAYIVTIIPSFIVCTIAYNNGLKGRRIFPERKKK